MPAGKRTGLLSQRLLAAPNKGTVLLFACMQANKRTVPLFGGLFMVIYIVLGIGLRTWEAYDEG